MITPEQLASRLRVAATTPPGGDTLGEAAKHIAQRVNDILTTARYPGRVEVVGRGHGAYRLVLIQTARVTRPTGGRSPHQLLHDAIAHELPALRKAIAVDARKALSP